MLQGRKSVKSPAKIVYCRVCHIVIGPGHIEYTPFHIGRKTYCWHCYNEMTSQSPVLTTAKTR